MRLLSGVAFLVTAFITLAVIGGMVFVRFATDDDGWFRRPLKRPSRYPARHGGRPKP